MGIGVIGGDRGRGGGERDVPRALHYVKALRPRSLVAMDRFEPLRARATKNGETKYTVKYRHAFASGFPRLPKPPRLHLDYSTHERRHHTHNPKPTTHPQPVLFTQTRRCPPRPQQASSYPPPARGLPDPPLSGLVFPPAPPPPLARRRRYYFPPLAQQRGLHPPLPWLFARVPRPRRPPPPLPSAAVAAAVAAVVAAVVAGAVAAAAVVAVVAGKEKPAGS